VSDLRPDRQVTIRLSPLARRFICREAALSADGNETGGVLLGFDPNAAGEMVVTQAGDPGPCAIRNPDFFNRDLKHSQALADAAYRLDRSRWIGDWHTHPLGGSTPSGKDMKTYRSFLATEDLDFSVFLAVIVTPDQEIEWEAPDLRGWLVTEAGAQEISLDE
jgi:integrative and conjugative element protein (TIGR02256 family)